MKITLRFPTAAYAYAEVQIEGDSGAELEHKLADVQRAAALAIQITGGGDSASIAERLLGEELGATRIEEGMTQEQPGLTPPTAPVAAPTPPWAAAQGKARPAPPWAAPAAPMNPYGAAPANPFPPLVKLPYGKDGTDQATANKWVKDHAFAARNKLVWNKDRKGFEFERTPDPALLAAITQMAQQARGSVE